MSQDFDSQGLIHPALKEGGKYSKLILPSTSPHTQVKPFPLPPPESSRGE